LVTCTLVVSISGMLAASATSNETAFLTWKVARSFGMVVFDNQARV
jgi:formate dehydrogenase major subunit